MAELIFEPFAARLRWTLPEPNDGQAWSRVIATYLETLAERCDESRPSLIGHIKAFALLPGGYLRVNVTSASAADVEARATEPCVELTLTLNVLVYGLPAEALASLATKTATEVASTFDGNAILVERE